MIHLDRFHPIPAGSKNREVDCLEEIHSEHHTDLHLQFSYRNTRIRIRPQNVAQKSRIRHVTRPRNVGNLLHLCKFWTQPTVHANNFVINDCRARQAIERVTKLLPHFNREATTALVIETVDTVDTGTFVISAEQEEVFRILDLVRKKKTDHFYRLFASVDVIA